MKPNNEPEVWVTVVKLIVGVVVIVGGVGLALWFALQVERNELPTPSMPSQSWGIANDSPIR